MRAVIFLPMWALLSLSCSRELPKSSPLNSERAPMTFLMVDEGSITLSIPREWEKKETRGIDSHVGVYLGSTVELRFDEVFGLGATPERAAAIVESLTRKSGDSSLLGPGEEVWYLDGQVCGFHYGPVDPKIHGERRLPNVATIYVPYVSPPGYLRIYMYYTNEADLPIVRRVLQSVVWRKKPNQALQTTSVTRSRFERVSDSDRQRRGV